MKNLHTRSIEFANSILGHWHSNQPEEHTPEKHQQNYLYSMGCGVVATARSAGILVENSQHHDIPVLARVLLERYIKSIYASLDPQNALTLFRTEIRGRIKALKQSNRECETNFSEAILRAEADLARFELITEEGSPVSLSTYSIFEKVNLPSLYRSAYTLYCGDAHGGFHSGYGEAEFGAVEKFLVLMAPVDVAHGLHGIVTGNDHEDYETLKSQVVDYSFPNSNRS